MSGPVWRRLREPEQVCDVCLQKSDDAFVEGIIEGGEFVPRRRICDECYRHSNEASD